MYRIRPEQQEDVVAIREVHTLAFKGDSEANLVDAIRASEFFVPDLSLIALTDQVIGHILFSIVSIETMEGGAVPTLGLAPMAVLPEYQNQGIGSALVRAGLSRASELGFKHAVVLGHPQFYPRFGFVASSDKGIESPFPVPDDTFLIYEIENGSLNGISGRVKYPSAFAVVS